MLVAECLMLRAKDVARIEAEARAGSTEPVFANAA
jgi:hypothetical protein